MVYITMYNMQFGECITIDRGGSEVILSDFGSKCARKDITPIYEKVMKELKSLDKDIYAYISHFHSDHIDGFLYAMTNKIDLNIKKFVLPNIKNMQLLIAYFSEVTILSILQKVLKVSKAHSLYDFIYFFNPDVIKNTKFVTRGNLIDGNKILWPKEADKIAEDIKPFADFYREFIKALESNYSFTESILECAGLIYDIIDKTNQENWNGKNNFEKLNRLIEELKKQIECLDITEENLRQNFNKKNLASELYVKLVEIILGKRKKESLNNVGHAICLVFHNANMCLENYIFTGDIQKNNLNSILNNSDGKPDCRIYNNYKFFKIPHHGTDYNTYGVDFQKYITESSYIIISNGKRSKHSGRGKKPRSSTTWCIDAEYYNTKRTKYIHFCSNTNNCNGRYRKGCCTCKKHVTCNINYKNTV